MPSTLDFEAPRHAPEQIGGLGGWQADPDRRQPLPEPNRVAATLDGFLAILSEGDARARAEDQAREEHMKFMNSADRIAAEAERRKRFVQVDTARGLLKRFGAILEALPMDAASDSREAMCIRLVVDTIAAFSTPPVPPADADRSNITAKAEGAAS